MSSTDDDAAARALAFFSRHLLPTADGLRTRGVAFFPKGPEPERESWYVTYPAATPEFIEAEPEQVAGALRDLWAAQDLPELVALVEPLMELARTWEEAEDSSDVSPFIYVMF